MPSKQHKNKKWKKREVKKYKINQERGNAFTHILGALIQS